jgi:pimeloyl-ACP methyl ester carboxylesterase
MSAPLLFLRIAIVLWAVIVCPLAVLLLFSSTTPQGTAFAIGALLLGLAPALAFLRPGIRWVHPAGLVAFGLWLLIAVALVIVSPNGHPRPNARVQNRYSDGAWHYQRFALGSLLPEVDQYMLGFKLVPAVDSLFTVEQSRALSSLTRTIYRELEADPDFHALGSAMPQAYDEIWGRRFDRGHYFLYIPSHLDRTKPAPALVFLHGSGGNFKAYTWLLSKVADERNMILLAPTFGAGNWETKPGVHAVMAALRDAARILPLDMTQVHLAGLSNGGLGVSRIAASEHGAGFRSLIFLSPVCDHAALASHTFSAHIPGKPILIITGEQDDRVPLSYVTSCADAMKHSRANVELITYPDADHFLVFSHRDRFLAQFSDWLKRHSTTP